MIGLRVKNNWKAVCSKDTKHHMRFAGDRGIASLRTIGSPCSRPTIIGDDRSAMGLH